MVVNAFKSRIIPLVDGSNSQYFEEKDSDWIKNLEKLIELKNELIGLDDKFNANFDLNEDGTKNVSIAEIKRFVDDIDSGKTNNEKTAIERYVKYI